MFSVFKSRGFRTPWHLRVLYISTFLLRTAFGALLLLFTDYVPGEDDYDMLLSIAIIAVPYPLAEMVTANYFGILSDRIGRKPVIVMGTTVAAIVVALYTLSNNVWYIATMHGIHGIGAAATVAPAIAMIADHAHTHDRGRQMGWFDYSTFLGYIMGAVAGGYMLSYAGPRAGFVIVAIMLVGSAMMLQMMVKYEKVIARAAHVTGFADLKRVFKIREIKLMFPIWLVIATLLGLAITYLPRIMRSENIEGSTIGLLFGAAGVVLGLLQPFWGKVSDIVGRIPVMAYGVFSIAGIVIMMLFFSHYAFEVTDEGVEFKLLGMIPLGVMGLGAGAFVPSALAMMADSTDQSCYGATMGLYSFALGFGAFIAETIGLGIILASGRTENPEETAPLWLLYFAALLVAIAVFMIIVFFLSNLRAKKQGRKRAECP